MSQSAKLISFDVSANNFDAAVIAEKLKGLIDGDIWNFIPGLFVIKSEMPWKDVEKKLALVSDFPNFLAIEFDPAQVTGNLPPAAWDSWFLDLFHNEIDRAAEINGWTPGYVEKVKAYQAKKRKFDQ